LRHPLQLRHPPQLQQILTPAHYQKLQAIRQQEIQQAIAKKRAEGRS
jgi:hypothetical protein